MLRLVSSERANDVVFLSDDAIFGSLGIALGFCSLVLGLASGVLLFTRVGPAGGTSEVAYGLDGCSLEGVILAGALAREVCQ